MEVQFKKIGPTPQIVGHATILGITKYGSRDENPKRSDTFNTISDGKNLYMANLPQKPNYPD